VYTAAVYLVGLLLVTYWLRLRVWKEPSFSPITFPMLLLMLVLLVVQQRSADDFTGPQGPVLLAIAADVSLSMGTIPDPATNSDIGTRLARAQRVMLPLLTQLSATARSTMISVTAFTSKSETLLAWDDDLSLAREIIEYVLTTGLLTEAGSDVGIALTGVVPLFESLPHAFRDPERAKFLILVSDGEQTMTRAGNVAMLGNLRELGVQVISLHVGLEETPEGLPVYDENDSFMGFEEVDGQIFSVPDAELMRTIAGDDPARGLFVRAESADAVTSIMNFIGVQANGSTTNTIHFGAIIAVWALIIVTLLRYGFEE